MHTHLLSIETRTFTTIHQDRTGKLILTHKNDAGKLILTTVPATRGQAPKRPLIPTSPLIQECGTQQAPARTYQDLLNNEHDEALFEHYATTQLVELDISALLTSLNGGNISDDDAVNGGIVRCLGKPGMYMDYSVSPDGKYLLVEEIKRPFSRLVLYNR